MADYTPEQLESLLNDFKKSTMPPEVKDELLKQITEGSEPFQAKKVVEDTLSKSATQAEQKLGSLASQNQNLEKLKAIKSKLNAPNFEMVGSPQSKDFVRIGEPFGGSVAKIEQAATHIPEGGLRVAAENALVPAERVAEHALVPVEQQALKSAAKMGLGKMLAKGAVIGVPMIGAGLWLQDALSPSGMDENDTASKPPEAYGPPTPPQTQVAAAASPQAEAIPEPEKQAMEQPSVMDRLLGILGSKSAIAGPLDASGLTVGSNDELKRRQAEADRVRLIAGLGQAGDIIGSSIAHTAPKAQDLFKGTAEGADQLVKDYKEQIENQKYDPNSAVSKAYRSEVERLTGQPIKGNPSAADLEKIIQPIFKQVESEDNRKARMATAALYASQKQDDKQRLRDQFSRSEALKYQLAAEKATKDIREQLQASQGIGQMVDLAKDNPIAKQSLGVMAAKARGERGNLSENDVTRYVQNKAIANRVADWINTAANGTILPVNAEFMKEVEAAVQGRLQDNLTKAYDRFAMAHSRNTGIPFEESKNLIRTDDYVEPTQQKQVAPSLEQHKTGEVKILQNGKKTVWDGKGWKKVN